MIAFLRLRMNRRGQQEQGNNREWCDELEHAGGVPIRS